MNFNDVITFMKLGGQEVPDKITSASREKRCLAASLLLSEVLEYVIKGLGVTPRFKQVDLTEPDSLEYECNTDLPDFVEMIDGLADTAYTMYWNALTFGIPIEEAFDRVCKNNLEKFVKLTDGTFSEGLLENSSWDCGQGISWPAEVALVEVIKYQDSLYAVGRDKNGKVRKPSSYKAVILSDLVA
ncbi:MAG: nucleoside triphosphate pyrophosphohydrolase family protein [Bdellovibrionales bacterium]|nr:nucleoside triphosphate pyrophosphohydrolase family protein [Bdellovibrionales bacterium]